MKALVLALIAGGILLARTTICLNPICGHPKWTHGKGGACLYDTCERFQNR
jgi:hypothetical protein